MEAIEWVGTQTEADCFEPLSRFWDPDRDENDQAKEASDLMSEHNLEASCYTLDSNFAVYDEAAYRACIERCIERLDTALLLHADTIRLDPRSSLPGPPEEADLDDVLERIAKAWPKSPMRQPIKRSKWASKTTAVCSVAPPKP